MSRFKRLSHSIWCCEYHIVWVSKYRYRILQGAWRISCQVRQNISNTLNPSLLKLMLVNNSKKII